jgi:hypothetical protein
MVWFAFDDGGRIEMVIPPNEARRWRDYASRAMRERGANAMSTRQVTRFINCAAEPWLG